jgi:Protein of unknown function (DUF2934)
METTATGRHTRRAAAAQPARSPATRRTRAQAADHASEVGEQVAFDPDLRHRMISEAAYYLYAQRGYAEGYDLDDWLQAEAQVDDLIVNPEREDTREVSALLASP